MKILVSLLVISAALDLWLTAIAYPVNIPVVPLHPVGDSIDIAHTTTAPNPEQRISLSRFTTMVHRLVGALQFIWIIVKENVRKSYNYV